jgi:hypothetical protein
MAHGGVAEFAGMLLTGRLYPDYVRGRDYRMVAGKSDVSFECVCSDETHISH